MADASVTGRPAALGGEPLTSLAAWPTWPVWDEREEEALQAVLASGRWQAGPQVEAFEREFAAYQRSEHAVCVTNGTSSLEMALRAAGVGPGDEVVVPAYTFAATGLAVLTVGAHPVLVDSSPEVLNIDPGAAAAALTARTKAIIPVHVGGHPVDLDAFQAMAREHRLALIEDAAHAHGAEWLGARVGAHGTCASFSFQTGKSMTSGDGGCLTTSDAGFAERLRSLRDFGRSGGEIVRVGGNHRMTEFQAAVLRCQLGRLDEQIARRESSVALLRAALEDVAGVRVASPDPRVTRHPHYQVLIHLDPGEFGLGKARLQEALLAEGIPVEGGYQPLTRLPVFAQALAEGRATAHSCPVAERAADDGILWLSFRMALAAPEQIELVAVALARLQAHAPALREAP